MSPVYQRQHDGQGVHLHGHPPGIWGGRVNVVFVSNPIPAIYGIFAYSWLIFMGNVDKYTIHGCYGNLKQKLAISLVQRDATK